MLLLSDNQYHKHDNHRSTPINEFLQLIVIIVDSIILVSQKSIKKEHKKRNLTKNYLIPYNIINQQFWAQWKSTGDVFFVSWYFVSLHYEHT